MDKKKLIREQLDASLKRFGPLAEAAPPSKGWVRTVRNALGMTARQLAGRLGVAQQAVSRIEKQELEGSVTIKTMRRIGDSLDCIFVYGFVPQTSLEETITRHARLVAKHRLNQANQTMNQKNQVLNSDENEQVLSNLVDALIQTLPATFWDIHD